MKNKRKKHEILENLKLFERSIKNLHREIEDDDYCNINKLDFENVDITINTIESNIDYFFSLLHNENKRKK